MQLPNTLLLPLLALAALTTAQLELPACATTCFTSAIAASGCGATDYLCQCTTGQTAIQDSAIPCLCHSTCQSSDLIAVIQGSNKVCSSALEAAGQTYTAATVGLGACASAGSATSTGSGTVATGTGMATGSATSGSAASATATTASAAGSGSGSATASAAQQTNSSGARSVKVEALLGLAGLAAFAL
ncbi:SWI/SNF and RSC complex subunit Ssr1 [Teratosphaeriaceae sp. CCFEE 6253]|nr:SWI/SNF and RSC complex subunit Ssr1 [Teratosphaeriaceae sp. CCFEE 6253]